MLRRFALPIFFLTATTLAGAARDIQVQNRLGGSYRQPARNGWTFVHLEGSPEEIGFQNGFLLAPEIVDMQKVIALELDHDSRRKWPFYRAAAKNVLWPHIEDEYRRELQGIADGLRAKGVKLDVWDVVALNAALEWPYYTKSIAPPKKAITGAGVVGDHCSAFVATGSYTKDGRPVIAHNNWTGYLDGERWTVVYDIAPRGGNRFLMDGMPGVIHSADDFGINSSGIMVTETTITAFNGWDSNGIPEFVRARKAMQYANSIDDFARIMKDGNNGGYANDWLVADRKTGEIASLELGLKNVTLERTQDGYFVGSNFPINPKLIREETTFNQQDASTSANARHVRWDALMAQNKGQIDVAMAERFLADHYDVIDGKEAPSERTLCGHIDLSPRGMGDWQGPFAAAGAVQNKAADASMAERMAFWAYAGHACGIPFRAAEHLEKNPQSKWQKSLLRDMNPGGWAEFAAAK